jgi:hypothetical protein
VEAASTEQQEATTTTTSSSSSTSPSSPSPSSPSKKTKKTNKTKKAENVTVEPFAVASGYAFMYHALVRSSSGTIVTNINHGIAINWPEEVKAFKERMDEATIEVDNESTDLELANRFG